jgi:hypothetical protein
MASFASDGARVSRARISVRYRCRINRTSGRCCPIAVERDPPIRGSPQRFDSRYAKRQPRQASSHCAHDITKIVSTKVNSRKANEHDDQKCKEKGHHAPAQGSHVRHDEHGEKSIKKRRAPIVWPLGKL